jgi:hypothetical protein
VSGLPDLTPFSSSPNEGPATGACCDSCWSSSLIHPRFWLLTALVTGAVLARWLPHPPNFTPIGALALFGGSFYADRRLALTLPLLALFLSDLAIGLHLLMPVVYGSFACNVLLGRWLRHHWGVWNLAAVTVLGSIQFYLTTNFACWLMAYPHTLAGLIDCYVKALPFFRNTLLGDATFVVVLFGAVAVAERLLPVLRERTNQPATT